MDVEGGRVEEESVRSPGHDGRQKDRAHAPAQLDQRDDLDDLEDDQRQLGEVFVPEAKQGRDERGQDWQQLGIVGVRTQRKQHRPRMADELVPIREGEGTIEVNDPSLKEPEISSVEAPEGPSHEVDPQRQANDEEGDQKPARRADGPGGPPAVAHAQDPLDNGEDTNEREDRPKRRPAERDDVQQRQASGQGHEPAPVQLREKQPDDERAAAADQNEERANDYNEQSLVLQKNPRRYTRQSVGARPGSRRRCHRPDDTRWASRPPR